VIRSTRESKEHRFQIGEPPAPVGGPPGAAAAGAPLVIAPTSKFVAFAVYPTAKEAKRLKAQRRPLYNKLALVNVATGEKKEFDKVRRFAFSGELAGWLAMQAYPAEGGAPAPAAPAPGGAPAAPRVEGTDLLLYNLATGELVNIGNVAEFAFDDSGEFLAYTIDARDRLGNGVQLRNMKTDVVKALDSERSLYRRLAWADSGPSARRAARRARQRGEGHRVLARCILERGEECAEQGSRRHEVLWHAERDGDQCRSRTAVGRGLLRGVFRHP
jgi:hypothetical protein